MENRKRVFLIVLDSVGIGYLPDAADYDDVGANTMRSISASPNFSIPVLRRLGLPHIAGLSYLNPTGQPEAAVARAAEASRGKDTTIGHWEIAGLVSPAPLPTYPNGFPDEILDEFKKQSGHGVLCNKPYSGTEVIRDYGEEHMRSGDLIVYTSADSVFQIAAHEDVVPVEQLYEYCRIARRLLVGRHGVGRVIARPFNGSWPFTRTSRRHDFSLEPPGQTMLDAIRDAGLDTLSVGKIYDIFAGQGITDHVFTAGNADGMRRTAEYAQKDFHGLCFINLVDFDMLYGHRNNIAGYAQALTDFDTWLGGFLPTMRPDDLLIITADHGCDPGFKGTDHSREYTPVLFYGASVRPGNLGTFTTFADIAATVTDWLGVPFTCPGRSHKNELERSEEETLLAVARNAMQKAYTPYSHFKVGAALLGRDGRIYTGCNIENSSLTPTICAERTAFFKAISEGSRDFDAIAVIGGENAVPRPLLAPCGVCRQVMMEFCDPMTFRVILWRPDGYESVLLKDMLPYGFLLDPTGDESHADV